MNVKLAIFMYKLAPKINSYIILILLVTFVISNHEKWIKRWKRIEERKGEKFRKFKYPSNEMRNEEIHGPMKI